MSIAILAGYGKLLLILGKCIKNKKFIVIDLDYGRNESYFDKCHKYYAVKNLNVAEITNILIKEKIKKCIILGKVDKSILYRGSEALYNNVAPILKNIDNWQDNSIKLSIASFIEKMNIKVEKQSDFLYSFLTEDIIYSERRPNESTMKDITFGYKTAKVLVQLDIGQTVVVKNGVVLAVEAVEGTDEAIKRGGLLGGVGSTVVKVAKVEQDERFDVPTVGVNTLETMLQCNCSTLVVEAGKTFIIENEKMRDFVNKNNMILMGYKEA
jgi:DUF1009 family protein